MLTYIIILLIKNYILFILLSSTITKFFKVLIINYKKYIFNCENKILFKILKVNIPNYLLLIRKKNFVILKKIEKILIFLNKI